MYPLKSCRTAYTYRRMVVGQYVKQKIFKVQLSLTIGVQISTSLSDLLQLTKLTPVCNLSTPSINVNVMTKLKRSSITRQNLLFLSRTSFDVNRKEIKSISITKVWPDVFFSWTTEYIDFSGPFTSPCQTSPRMYGDLGKETVMKTWGEGDKTLVIIFVKGECHQSPEQSSSTYLSKFRTVPSPPFP